MGRSIVVASATKAIADNGAPLGEADFKADFDEEDELCDVRGATLESVCGCSLPTSSCGGSSNQSVASSATRGGAATGNAHAPQNVRNTGHVCAAQTLEYTGYALAAQTPKKTFKKIWGPALTAQSLKPRALPMLLKL